MCPFFKNKYRIGSTRLAGYDYSSAGKYFITICTKKKIEYLGYVQNGKIILSDLGMYLKDELLKTPEIRKDMAIVIDEYVIMPDHFHAIIFIGKNRYNDNKIHDGHKKIHHDRNKIYHDRNKIYHDRRNAMHGVSTMKTKTKTKTKTQTSPMCRKIARHGDFINKFGPQSKNLSSIIRGIKSVVTTYSKKTKQDFAWQPNFHDRVIRTNLELQCIRKYIRMNPERWTN